MKISIQQLSNLVKKAKSEPSAEDLMKRPCCGSGCTNCPYSPKHKKGNTKVREELKKEAKIVKDKKSGKWILYTKDGSRILGKHENAQDAYKQEYAIQKSMEKKANPQQTTQAKEVDNPHVEAAVNVAGIASDVPAVRKAVAPVVQKAIAPVAKFIAPAAKFIAPAVATVKSMAPLAPAVLPLTYGIDTAGMMLPGGTQRAVDKVEDMSKQNPAYRMLDGYVNPVSTGYGITSQTNQMVNSNNAALRSEQNYINALDRRTTDAYYKGYGTQLRAQQGLYTYPKTTPIQRQNTITPVQPQLAKQSSILFNGFSKKSEDNSTKSDQEISIITKPNKTPRNGFIRDPKTNRLMVQDRRFNLVQPKEEIVKASFADKPKKVIEAILKGDKNLLSTLGKHGNKVKQKNAIQAALESSRKLEKHLQHPDTQHFLSILEKENNIL